MGTPRSGMLVAAGPVTLTHIVRRLAASTALAASERVVTTAACGGETPATPCRLAGARVCRERPTTKNRDAAHTTFRHSGRSRAKRVLRHTLTTVHGVAMPAASNTGACVRGTPTRLAGGTAAGCSSAQTPVLRRTHHIRSSSRCCACSCNEQSVVTARGTNRRASVAASPCRARARVLAA